MLKILEDMQASDQRFDHGIELLQIDLAEIASDVRAIREEMTDQRQARLSLCA